MHIAQNILDHCTISKDGFRIRLYNKNDTLIGAIMVFATGTNNDCIFKMKNRIGWTAEIETDNFEKDLNYYKINFSDVYFHYLSKDMQDWYNGISDLRLRP